MGRKSHTWAPLNSWILICHEKLIELDIIYGTSTVEIRRDTKITLYYRYQVLCTRYYYIMNYYIGKCQDK
jgi:hypothetical protein